MSLTVVQHEFNSRNNNKAHRTDEISKERLIVRRGQVFSITLCFNRTFRQGFDKLQLTVETGPQPSVSDGTQSVIDVASVEETQPSVSTTKSKSWGGTIQSTQQNEVTLAVSSPSDACIGTYTLTVQTGTPPTNNKMGSFILLFNPWCSEDEVFLHQEDEWQEYVMNEHGLLYRGQHDAISAVPWTFGQFEKDIVDICLWMLDFNPKKGNPVKDCVARSSPVYISRVLSAMINCNDDSGVLVGCWDGDYSDGVHPGKWSDSVEILQKWYKQQGKGVKYGQCWVFAAVLCTVLRCLGIPARVITNFASAHDSDGNLSIDTYIGGTESSDSIWNFHVWVEAWMRRSDLSGDYGGWQVVDATPQESSEGLMRCGPAPVKAILEGHTKVKYDVPFVFAEVNADEVTWAIQPDGSKRKVMSNPRSVGMNISTKAVGKNERQDVTNNYKYPEGSAKERQVYELAVKEICGSSTVPKLEPRPEKPLAVELKFVQGSKPINGQDIVFSLSVRSNSPTVHSLKVTITAHSIWFNGLALAELLRKEEDVKLQPNTEVTIAILIPYSQYKWKTQASTTIRLQAMAVPSSGGDTFLEKKNIKLESPALTMITPKICKLNHDFTAELVFENPLPEPLKDCSITLTGAGLLEKPCSARTASLDPKKKLIMKFKVKPYRAGSRKLVANFHCNLFKNIKTFQDITVN
ncbi:protein-glutamine gamma-glutamyltransferase 5 [Amia ocellicauda]|uniref:protein-glutamine gamma-glutamyltransferase 5 n=1 Tax=Amia ocellicauda TaxID=2972642 RepID=UPI003463D3EF